MTLDLLQTLYDIREFFLNVITHDSTGQTLLAISVGVLTIFIPVAISLFSNGFDNKQNVIDRAVILDYIIGGKNLLYTFALLFFPVLLWQGGNPIINLFIIEVWTLGLALSLFKLNDMYTWVRGVRIPIILKYLKADKNQIDEPQVWEAMWSFPGIGRLEQNELVAIYVAKINHLFQTASLDSLALLKPMLESLNVVISNRAYYVLGSEGLFKEILTWHLKSWQGELNHLGNKDNIMVFAGFDETSRILDVIFEKIMSDSLQSHHAYGFFEVLKTHVELNSETNIKVIEKERYYLEDILGIFYRKFFDHISNSGNQYELWNHYFPKEWTITIKNLDEHIPSRVSLQQYLEWAMERIRNGSQTESNVDIKLDEVTREMFPETHPMFWSILLTYTLRAWGENRIKSLIEKERIFGHIGRMISWSGSRDDRPDMSKMAQESDISQFECAVQLMDRIFPNVLPKPILEGYITEIKSLSYEDSGIENNRKEILEYFERVKNYREKPVKM